MELILPDQISLDKVSLALMREIEETARRVHEYRPLSPDVVRRIQDDLVPVRVQRSNAIEGNTLDLRETKMILETGKLIASKRREAMEARNLGKAVRALLDIGVDDMSIHSRERLLEIHELVLREIDDEKAGRFRDYGVKIAGAAWKPPDHGSVPTLMDRVLERLAVKGDESALLMGVWAHWAFAAIHPFGDGNGRTARLWQDLVFCQRGLTCATIRPEEKGIYFAAIQDADDGDFNPLLRLIGQRMLSTFDLYDQAIATDVETTEWARRLVAGVDDSGVVEGQIKYRRWMRRMEELRNAFHICAKKITEASDAIDAAAVSAVTPDYYEYENLRNGVGGGETFFFFSVRSASRKIEFDTQFDDGTFPEQDAGNARSKPHVHLVFRYYRPQPTTLLTSVFVADDGFTRARECDGKTEYDRVSSMQIAMDCIEDMIRTLNS